MKVRTLIMQTINFGLTVCSALMMWRIIQPFCNTESPAVVVLSGSMEPGMYRGDILILRKFDIVNNGDMIVYKIPTDPIPIVHRVASV